RAEHDDRGVERRHRLVSGAPAGSRHREAPRPACRAARQPCDRLRIRRSGADRRAVVRCAPPQAARRAPALGDVVTAAAVRASAAPMYLGITIGNLGGALVAFSYFSFIDPSGRTEWSGMPGLATGYFILGMGALLTAGVMLGRRLSASVFDP